MRKLLAWLLILLLPFATGAEEALFNEGEPHKFHLDYRQYFETMTATVGDCALFIAADAYDLDTAQTVYAQIASDEAALAALTALRPHAIYVVKKPLAGLQRIDSAIYCTAQQVLDGSYRPWLVEAALGLQRWQAVGAAGYAFGAVADAEALCAWYADEQHDDMLSLFPAYFVEDFAAPEELHMAEQTAIALFGYIAGQAGLEAALAAEPSAYVPGWLASLGIDRVYEDAYTGLLDGYTYTHNQFYAMIAVSPRGDVFKMNPLPDMTTPDQVRQALCDLEMAVDAILAGVQRDAPDWYPVLAKHYEAPITYEFNEAEGYSLTYVDSRRITLGAAVSIIHETAHIMAPCRIERRSRYMDTWKVEAIAEYLTHAYYNGQMEQETVFTYMQDSYINAHELQEMRDFYTRTKEIYLENAPLPETFREVNLNLWWRAAALAGIETDMGLNSVVDVYAGAGSASLEAMNGNELSYTESEWLASYLINRHGLSTFLHYCMDEGVSFEEAFGMPYETAKEEWLQTRTLLD